MRCGADTGGTFTDVMLMHRESGQLWTVKTPSTPADSSEGFFQGIQKMLSLTGIAPEAVDHVLHGSTVATNTILEGKGASTGMISSVPACERLKLFCSLVLEG